MRKEEADGPLPCDFVNCEKDKDSNGHGDDDDNASCLDMISLGTGGEGGVLDVHHSRNVDSPFQMSCL